MNSMFEGCSKLKSLDLSNFDTFEVTDMSGIPFGRVLFCFYLLCFGLFLAAFHIAGGNGGIRYLVIAPIFTADGAFFTLFLENRYQIKNWKTEADLTHNPRKYILPIALMIEAAIVGFI